MQVNSSSHLPSSIFHSQARLPRQESRTDSNPQTLQQRTQAGNAHESDDQLAEQRQLQQLKTIDRKVRAHELAHIAAGGRYVTSGARFDYERGSDGRQYAVAGEVSIDTSEIPGDPQATLRKAQVILRAALAPADPSAQDRRVATQAISMMQQARLALSLQQESTNQSPLGGQVDTFA